MSSHALFLCNCIIPFLIESPIFRNYSPFLRISFSVMSCERCHLFMITAIWRALERRWSVDMFTWCVLTLYTSSSRWCSSSIKYPISRICDMFRITSYLVCCVPPSLPLMEWPGLSDPYEMCPFVACSCSLHSFPHLYACLCPLALLLCVVSGLLLYPNAEWNGFVKAHCVLCVLHSIDSNLISVSTLSRESPMTSLLVSYHLMVFGVGRVIGHCYEFLNFLWRSLLPEFVNVSCGCMCYPVAGKWE